MNEHILDSLISAKRLTTLKIGRFLTLKGRYFSLLLAVQNKRDIYMHEATWVFVYHPVFFFF